MDANSSERPTADELFEIFHFWHYCSDEEKKFGYKGKEIKAAFEEADKEIPNISTSYEKIVMLYILVELLHLAIHYQNLLIFLILLHTLIMKKILKVIYF